MRLLILLLLVSSFASAIDVFPMETFQRFLALGKYTKYEKPVSLKTPSRRPQPPSKRILSEIRLVANYQAMSYCPLRKPADIAKMRISTWQQILYVETAQELVGYIMAADHKRKSIVLSFRGAMSNLQKEHTALVFQVPYDLIFPDTPKETPHVHYGFYWAYMSIRDQMLDLAARAKKHFPSYRFVVTGYSYAGPISVYAALDLSQVLKHPDRELSLVTFGSPRPGDRMFAKMVNEHVKHYYRVTHHHDSYPHFPPPSFKYENAGQEVYFTQAVMKKPVLCAKGLGEDKRCILGHGQWTNEKDHHEYWVYPECKKEEEWGDVVKLSDDAKKSQLEKAKAATDAAHHLLTQKISEEKFFDEFQKVPIQ